MRSALKKKRRISPRTAAADESIDPHSWTCDLCKAWWDL